MFENLLMIWIVGLYLIVCYSLFIKKDFEFKIGDKSLKERWKYAFHQPRYWFMWLMVILGIVLCYMK